MGAMFPMPRILWSMAEDGLMFKFLAQVNKKTKIPVNSTIICSIVAAVIAAVLELNTLIDFIFCSKCKDRNKFKKIKYLLSNFSMSIGTLGAYTLCAYCVLVLRYRRDEEHDAKHGPSIAQEKYASNLVSLVTMLYFILLLIASKAPVESQLFFPNDFYYLQQSCYILLAL